MKPSEVLLSRAVHFETSDEPHPVPKVPMAELAAAAQYLLRVPEWVEFSATVSHTQQTSTVENRRRVAKIIREAAALAESEGK